MPNLDVEMSDSSESREVEMLDAVEGPSASSPEGDTDRFRGSPATTVEHVTSDGHMTREPTKVPEKTSEGKTSTDEIPNGDVRPSNSLPSLSNLANGALSQEPLPSVETDETDSPATADEREAVSPAVEARRKDMTKSPSSRRNVPANALVPTAESIKTDKEIARLKEVLKEISPEAAQRVLREQWRMFLFDHLNEDHISFILRAGLKNANPMVLERVLKDDGIFKENLLKLASRKPGITDRVLQNTSPIQLSTHVPERILDKALAQRLKTLPAKQLIRWLAEAERLGYKVDDILDDEDESVVPNMSSRQSSQDIEMEDEVLEVEAQPHLNLANPYRDHLLAEQDRHATAIVAANMQAAEERKKQYAQAQSKTTSTPSLWECRSCSRRFPSFSGYTYHITKKVCTKQVPAGGWKWFCENCLSGFTTKQGHEYHVMRGVCHNDDIAPATSPSTQLQQEASSRTQPPPAQLQQELNSRPHPLPRISSDPILPPSRPPMYTQAPPASQQSIPQQMPPARVLPYVSQYTPARPPMEIPRPPINQPVSTPSGPRQKGVPVEVRQSPSELSPQRLAALERELEEADARYRQLIAEIPSTYTQAERDARLISLKNANATRKSQIRKAHGVSLRLREKDKRARIAAGIPSTARPRFEEFRAPPNVGRGSAISAPPQPSPPVASFSPVNAGGSGPNSNAPSPVNGYGHPPPPPQYKAPPVNAAQRVNNPMSSHPDTLTHALEAAPSASGFGVLRSSIPQHVTPTNYQAQVNYHPSGVPASSKRRRTESPNPTQPGSVSVVLNSNRTNQPYTPALSMMQVRAEDAASKYPKKVPVAQAQAKWDALQPKHGAAATDGGSNAKTQTVDIPMRDVALGASDENKKDSVITIISSSEDEDIDAVAKPKGVPKRDGHADEDARSLSLDDMARKREREQMLEQRRITEGGRGRGFMARRGGKH